MRLTCFFTEAELETDSSCRGLYVLGFFEDNILLDFSIDGRDRGCIKLSLFVFCFLEERSFPSFCFGCSCLVSANSLCGELRPDLRDCDWINRDSSLRDWSSSHISLSDWARSNLLDDDWREIRFISEGLIDLPFLGEDWFRSSFSCS